ncbi:Rop guanine nucleotide exchange factor like [Quillaja saponaria]|uniref:Rop guanine nucleotide exchange factor like n=1 Tax=Quillaja saponaria TaxID=32244 RepID=A0AAD7PW71_QUISA|nr:Rop guanine nucleotide exchange factor like [Quillaja saponaria]
MVRAFCHNHTMQKSRSFHFKKMFEIPGKHFHSLIHDYGHDGGASHDHKMQSRSYVSRNADRPLENHHIGPSLNRDNGPLSCLDCGAGASAKPKPTSEMEMMKERFAKLLLGEDMSGGGKGVSSALALSNAITNLAASVFGEHGKLEPLSPERKARWRKEIEWLLSVTDQIVEFVPSQQTSKDGSSMEIMVTRQRNDLLMNIPALRKLDAMLIEALDNFGYQNEFWYVSGDDDESETEMEIPDNYIESLPKNGRESLGDSIYKNITEECFDPQQFLSAMDFSTEHKVLDLKNRIEASIVIWKRKMHHKDGKSSWGSAVSLEKRELFEERVETILLLLKQQFPGLPQSALDISKIQYNKDVGQSILESYSRIIESLAFTVMSRIEDVLYAHSLTQNPSLAKCNGGLSLAEQAKSTSSGEDIDSLHSTDTQNSMTLSDFMGWSSVQGGVDVKKINSTTDTESYFKGENDKICGKPPKVVSTKKVCYLEKLENLSGLRSPAARH